MSTSSGSWWGMPAPPELVSSSAFQFADHEDDMLANMNTLSKHNSLLQAENLSATFQHIFAVGNTFNSASSLAQKILQLCRLPPEQLSQQDHYDFGMRAAKSVLGMVGQPKRKDPELDKDITLIRATRDSNVPKFPSHDLPPFTGIIAELFPGGVVPSVEHGRLQKEIENQLKKILLICAPGFGGEIIQLLETQLVRHGSMVVGVARTGKATNSSSVAKSSTQLRKDNPSDSAHQLTKVFSLNPKSITMDELYGAFNPNTGEWMDGLIALLRREALGIS